MELERKKNAISRENWKIFPFLKNIPTMEDFSPFFFFFCFVFFFYYYYSGRKNILDCFYLCSFWKKTQTIKIILSIFYAWKKIQCIFCPSLVASNTWQLLLKTVWIFILNTWSNLKSEAEKISRLFSWHWKENGVEVKSLHSRLTI